MVHVYTRSIYIYVYECMYDMRVTRGFQNLNFKKSQQKKSKKSLTNEVFHTQLHPPASSCFFSAFNARTTFSGGLEYTPNNMPATTIHIPTHPYAIGRPFPSP